MATICAFGCFDTEGARSWVIRKGLADAGYRIVFCNTTARGLLGKYRDLARRWKEQTDVDALYAVFPSHFLMPLAWRLARKKKIPVIFDAFLSLYDTDVCDRRRLSPWHPKAWLLKFVDRLACRLADVILLDTEEHKQYFMERYDVPSEKILVIPVGCRTDLFQPKIQACHGELCRTMTCSELSQFDRAHCDNSSLIRFYGTFIPLHGIETIIRAAKLLESEGVQFELLGKGQTYAAMRTLAAELQVKNVRFLDPVPLAQLPAFNHGADICLGIFGTSDKAQRVIPTKAYEILACGKPLITARSPACERVLTDREHVLFVEPGNAHALAEGIRELLENPSLAEHIAKRGHALFEEIFQPKMITAPLTAWLSQTRN
ncbi:MAG: glycosyltransferase family 4 protein [Candidatus Peribacteraceae bacterium]|nr:glycosyltransferase family 4 protein [Candidatus Peribacteraceae bacterium]MDD5075166.1 glycosyltransferase family 4 protein [Candidatus Peribacteraceae bacterium]